MKSTCHFCQILIKLKFSQQILKNTQILNLVKVHQRGAEFFHAKGRTDS